MFKWRGQVSFEACQRMMYTNNKKKRTPGIKIEISNKKNKKI